MTSTFYDGSTRTEATQGWLDAVAFIPYALVIVATIYVFKAYAFLTRIGVL